MRIYRVPTWEDSTAYTRHTSTRAAWHQAWHVARVARRMGCEPCATIVCALDPAGAKRKGPWVRRVIAPRETFSALNVGRQAA